mmetsp:Transcript_10658/g.26914  ORF Transcript_10658/g.26914 Transcript_10658/m.26914 type:complete len:128 (+) Transcript_10658:386-769(+)
MCESWSEAEPPPRRGRNGGGLAFAARGKSGGKTSPFSDSWRVAAGAAAALSDAATAASDTVASGGAGELAKAARTVLPLLISSAALANALTAALHTSSGLAQAASAGFVGLGGKKGERGRRISNQER